MTVPIEIPVDVEAVYHELLERLGPADRAALVRLLVEDGAQWHDYYSGACETMPFVPETVNR